MRQKLRVLAVLLGVLILYLPAVRYAFVSDDLHIILNNPRLAAWSQVPGYFGSHLFANIPGKSANYYRPLHLLALRLVYAGFGPPSAIWHLAPILIHLAAVACVFLLLRRLAGQDKAALLAAGLFAVHPIQTEAVAWVTCICDPLMTAFVVLSVYFYVSRKMPVSLLSILFATLAIFTKESGVVVPALIFAYEWTNSRVKTAALAASPYLIPVTLYVMLRTRALGHLSTQTPPYMSVGEMILTWPRMLAMYAQHVLFPLKLGFAYDIFVDHRLWPLLLLVAAAIGILWRLRQSSPGAQFGAAWLMITLAPALCIRYLSYSHFVHDRYIYLPSVGLALMAASWFSKAQWKAPFSVAACLVVLLLAWDTHVTLPVWQNNISLFERAAQTAPRDPIIKSNLAVFYFRSGRLDDSYRLLQEVIRIAPRYPMTYCNLGSYYQALGDYDQASRNFAICEQLKRQR